MAKCARCGRPGPGGLCPTCVGELRAAKAQQQGASEAASPTEGLYRPEADPTVVMDRANESVTDTRAQPRQDFQERVAPPQQHDHIPPSQAPAKKSKSRAPLIAFLTVLLLGMIGVGVWWFTTQGGFDFVQQQDDKAAPAEDEASEAEEDESSGADEEAAEDEGADEGPAAEADGDTPNLSQSIEGVSEFFAAAPGDPSAGWEFLSAKRQQTEDWTGFVTQWNGILGAKIDEDSCSMEESVLICDNEYTGQNGDVTVKKAERIPVVYEGGSVKLDSVDGATTETETSAAAEEPTETQAAAPEPGAPMTELDLEALRAETLTNGAPVGPIVAVLSTKRDGITDESQWAANGTHTFYYADIVALHHQLARQFSGEQMYFLQSRDVDDKKYHDLYYTVVDRGFTSDAEVVAWCQGAFPGLEGKELENKCLPRNLR